MNVIEVKIDAALLEDFVQICASWPLEGIWEEKEDTLKLFVLERQTENIVSKLEALGISFRIEMLEDKNWNAEWESKFDIVRVGDFCLIYAPFHNVRAEARHNILMQPKMAFGTGHHETTYMMIERMSSLDFDQRRVFDYGCGTGILSILAEKMGASEVFALDHEEPAFANSIENAEINDCNHIAVHLGTLEQVTDQCFDIILANINYAVLRQSADQLLKLAKDNSVLLLSGILQSQTEEIIDQYTQAGWKFVNKIQKGEWSCISLHR